ncbi:neuroblastoma-amplified sequence [Trichonephila clavipes]|nr:neuroblastoma-amplified sequence [Trichonephila clavipes]
MLQETEELENNILYELLIYAEWQQEPEVQGKGASERSDGNENDGYFGKWLGPLLSQPCPPLAVRQLNNLQMPWAFAIGGKHLWANFKGFMCQNFPAGLRLCTPGGKGTLQGALPQNWDGTEPNCTVTCMVFKAMVNDRTSRDEYGAIIGRTQVSKDPYPQWRRLLWSPDCTMLACAQSNGKLDFYDLIGAHMFAIDNMVTTNPQNGKLDFRFAIAGMAFSDVRVKNTQCPSDGFKTSHKSFSLSSCYPFGISCFVYHPVQNILIVCGKSQKLSLTSDKSAAAQTGISIWRMLFDSPYYKLTLSMEEQVDLVFKMSISPNGKILAAVHISGALSLWDLPSLRQLNLHVMHLLCTRVFICYFNI